MYKSVVKGGVFMAVCVGYKSKKGMNQVYRQCRSRAAAFASSVGVGGFAGGRCSESVNGA